MSLEVCEVFVAADDIINGNAFGHRKEIEVFRVADITASDYENGLRQITKQDCVRSRNRTASDHETGQRQIFTAEMSTRPLTMA